MRESSTYQVILNEGRIEEGRGILLMQGNEQFGPPTEMIKSLISSISTEEQIASLAKRILKVRSWEELLIDMRQ